MRFPFIAGVVAASTALILFCQETDAVYRVGDGVSPPQVRKKVDPEYSSEARAEHIEGTVLFRLVVDKSGQARDLEVLSPLGWGLDERAVEAISKWRFAPGQKDGKPVSVRAQIEVNFRFQNSGFDEREEGRRTRFNSAVTLLKKAGTAETREIETIRNLSRQG